MSEPDITALARRLAEQNNVDWRGLSGSGEGGKIVERDVLDYLARVMAGEEAVNPTPEPLPDGMEAWPEQDIATVRQGVGEAATLGELRHEIGSAVREEPEPAPAAPGVPVDSLDDDVFLFDDEPGAAEPAAHEAAPEAPTTAAAGDDLEDLLVSGDEPLPLDAADQTAPAGGEPAGSFGSGAYGAGEFGAMAGQADVDAFAAEEAAEPADEWGDGIELGQPRPGPVTDAPDIWGEPSRAGHDDVDLFGDAVGADGDASGAADAVAGAWGADDDGGAAQASAEGGDQPDPWAAVPPATDSTWSDTGTERPDPWGQQPEPVAEAAAPGPVEAPAPEPVEAQDEPDQAPGELVASSEPEPPSGVAEPDAGLEVEEGPADMLAAAPSLDSLPLARVSPVLRRHLDVSALAAAQLAVSRELGQEEPLGAAPFVLRAVAKAVAASGAVTGQVALAAFADGVVLRRVDGAATRPFADIVRELSEPGGEEDEAGLVVADLSSLDLDEVVLDLDVPVLSLGRILYDNQSGGYRSTLTLAGGLPAEAGARLLARVAELLAAPVRLVM